MIKAWLALHQKKIRYLLVGGSNTAAGFITFPLLMYLLMPLHLHYLVIFVLANIICVSYAYICYKLFVFKTQGNILRELIKFSSFYGLFFSVNLVLLPFFVNLFKISPIIAQTIINTGVFITSYVWHSKVSFVGSQQ